MEDIHFIYSYFDSLITYILIQLGTKPRAQYETEEEDDTISQEFFYEWEHNLEITPGQRNV